MLRIRDMEEDWRVWSIWGEHQHYHEFYHHCLQTACKYLYNYVSNYKTDACLWPMPVVYPVQERWAYHIKWARHWHLPCPVMWWSHRCRGLHRLVPHQIFWILALQMCIWRNFAIIVFSYIVFRIIPSSLPHHLVNIFHSFVNADMNVSKLKPDRTTW